MTNEESSIFSTMVIVLLLLWNISIKKIENFYDAIKIILLMTFVRLWLLPFLQVGGAQKSGFDHENVHV